MNLRDTVIRWLAPSFLERPAAKQSFAQLKENLERTASAIQERMAQAKASPQAVKQAQHVIGIERWGQSRLRVALGEPLAMDRYHAHKPEGNLPWPEYAQAFKATRLETLNLLARLEKANSEAKVPHNQFGPISVKAWLRYLNMHADMESRRIK